MRDLVADAPTAEERLLWEEEVSRLLSAVAELSERDREIIGLRYGSGMDTSTAAEARGSRVCGADPALARAWPLARSARGRHAMIARLADPRDLDALLGQIQFRPRASLEGEVAGRWARKIVPPQVRGRSGPSWSGSG